MKILISNAIGILLIFSIISCTEEISEEVQNKEAVSADGSIADYSSRSIRVVHKMDETLSFLMHKSGNFEADCELKAPTLGFSANDYDYTSTNYALDCVLDVQELDLYFNGASFELQVDDQLCEYIQYVPYSAWRFQPGTTSKELFNVKCDQSCLDAADTPAALQAACGNTSDGLYWDDYTDTTYTATNSITSLDDNFCKFDYATENEGSTWQHYPNCDEGKVSYRTFSYTGNPDSNGDGTADDPTCAAGILAVEEVVNDQDCGGEYTACIDGAALEDFNPAEFTSEITENNELESIAITKTYSKMFGDNKYNSNMKLANYSRICSETSTAKVSGTAGNFSGITFNGSQIEDIRGSQGYGEGKTYETQAVNERTVLADNMFRGLGYTKPYYAFNCLDKAYDVKAQIRLFIREWDRSFVATNTFMNSVTDTYLNEPQMDARFTKQTGDQNGLWNDISDIDDFFEQDTDADEIIDKNIWTSNQCTVSDIPFDSGNFPGRSF